VAVPREVTTAHVMEELREAAPLARERHWGMIWRPDSLLLLVTMFAHNGDPYLLQADCSDYKELPPIWDFIDPWSFAIGSKRAFPQANDSFFHSNGVICAPFNRRAYKGFDASKGPHDDWQMGSWMTCAANGTDWSNFSRLGDMIGAIDVRLRDPAKYSGRMEPIP
jgi:hypothetical protein